MNPEDFKTESRYPNVEEYYGELGSRLNKAANHCLNIYTEGANVWFGASASHGAEPNALDGILTVNRETAIEFLTQALENIKRVPEYQTRVLQDESGDAWFETQYGHWLCGRPNYKEYTTEDIGVDLAFIADKYGIKAGIRTVIGRD